MHAPTQQRPAGCQIQEQTRAPNNHPMLQLQTAEAAGISGGQGSTQKAPEAVQSGAAFNACDEAFMRCPQQEGQCLPPFHPMQPEEARTDKHSRQPLQPLVQAQQHPALSQPDVLHRSPMAPGSSPPACAMPLSDMTPPEVVDLTTDPTQPLPEPLQPPRAPAVWQNIYLDREVSRQKDGVFSIQHGPQAPPVRAAPQLQQRQLAGPAASGARPAAAQLALQAWEQPCLSQLAGGAGSSHAQVQLWHACRHGNPAVQAVASVLCLISSLPPTWCGPGVCCATGVLPEVRRLPVRHCSGRSRASSPRRWLRPGFQRRRRCCGSGQRHRGPGGHLPFRR